MNVNDAEIQAFARYLAGQRPDWGVVGVVSALRAALKEHAWLPVQHKALDVAADSQARTPQALNSPERWAKTVTDPGRPLTAAFCPRCRRVTVPQVSHDCTPGDPAHGISLLRTALETR